MNPRIRPSAVSPTSNAPLITTPRAASRLMRHRMALHADRGRRRRADGRRRRRGRELRRPRPRAVVPRRADRRRARRLGVGARGRGTRRRRRAAPTRRSSAAGPAPARRSPRTRCPGIRAALCGDAATAEGARRWNDANVLALSLRTTSEAELAEILDAWFAAARAPMPTSRERRAPGRARRGVTRGTTRSSSRRGRHAGWFDTRAVGPRSRCPTSLAGKRCLDVGTWDGFWAFEMERRGARGHRDRRRGPRRAGTGRPAAAAEARQGSSRRQGAAARVRASRAGARLARGAPRRQRVRPRPRELGALRLRLPRARCCSTCATRSARSSGVRRCARATPSSPTRSTSWPSWPPAQPRRPGSRASTPVVVAAQPRGPAADDRAAPASRSSRRRQIYFVPLGEGATRGPARRASAAQAPQPRGREEVRRGAQGRPARRSPRAPVLSGSAAMTLGVRSGRVRRPGPRRGVRARAPRRSERGGGGADRRRRPRGSR